MVGTADPVGLSRLARAWSTSASDAPVTPVRVVVNRMRPTLGWTERDDRRMVADFARPAGLHFLPEDRATADRALVTGRTLLETTPTARSAAPSVRLADALVPPSSPAASQRRSAQAANSRYSPPAVKQIIATSSGSWPVSWCFFGSSWIARSCAAITPTTWPSTTASTLSVASEVGW